LQTDLLPQDRAEHANDPVYLESVELQKTQDRDLMWLALALVGAVAFVWAARQRWR
jgi:hypothetical protein